MEHIPAGTILFLLVVDLLVVVLLSLSIALMVARSSGAPMWKGIVFGLLVPIVGPLVWGTVVATRDRDGADIHRALRRSPALYAVSAGLLLAALMFSVGSVAPWAHISGSFERHSLSGDVSAADTGVGSAGTLLTAIVLVMSVAIVLLWAPRLRVALPLMVVGSMWLLLSVDSLIVLDAVDGISRTVSGLSGGHAGADASAALGLWLVLIAAVVVLGAAIVLGFLPREGVPVDAPSDGPWTDRMNQDWGSPSDGRVLPPTVSAPSSTPSGADYGDGY